MRRVPAPISTLQLERSGDGRATLAPDPHLTQKTERKSERGNEQASLHSSEVEKPKDIFIPRTFFFPTVDTKGDKTFKGSTNSRNRGV